MNITTQLNQGALSVTMKGQFTFADHADFRAILQQIPDLNVKQVVFHMGGVDFIDSAALGMLLLALDETERFQKKLAVAGVSGQVKKMFEMARFNTLFDMVA